MTDRRNATSPASKHPGCVGDNAAVEVHEVRLDLADFAFESPVDRPSEAEEVHDVLQRFIGALASLTEYLPNLGLQAELLELPGCVCDGILRMQRQHVSARVFNPLARRGVRHRIEQYADLENALVQTIEQAQETLNGPSCREFRDE